MKRFGQQRVLAAIVAMLVIVGAAQETPPPPQSPAPTQQDAPAPEPHPELKPLVEDIRTLLGNGKFQDALPKADDLLRLQLRHARECALNGERSEVIGARVA